MIRGFLKILLIIIVGFLISILFRLGISEAIVKGYNIDVLPWSGSGSYHFIDVILVAVSTLFGGFFIGYNTRKKGKLYSGIAPLPFIIFLFALLLIAGEDYLGVHNLLKWAVWSIINLVFFIIGGGIGEYVSKNEGYLLGEDEYYSYEYEEIPTYERKKVKLKPYRNLIDFYFSLKWGIILTILLLITFFYWFILFSDNFIRYVKWEFIGQFYVLVHPVLWIMWWILPFWNIIFPLLIFTTLIPLFTIYWMYKIWVIDKQPWEKFLYSVILYIGVILVCIIFNFLGHIPINWTINVMGNRGKIPWSILLDKTTYPTAHYRLSKYYEEKGVKDKADAEREKVIDFLSKEGCKFFDRGMYKEAADYFEQALNIKQNDVVINFNLALTYEELNIAKAIEQWEKYIKIVKNLPESGYFIQRHPVIGDIYYKFGEIMSLPKPGQKENIREIEEHIEELKKYNKSKK